MDIQNGAATMANALLQSAWAKYVEGLTVVYGQVPWWEEESGTVYFNTGMSEAKGATHTARLLGVQKLEGT